VKVLWNRKSTKTKKNAESVVEKRKKGELSVFFPVLVAVPGRVCVQIFVKLCLSNQARYTHALAASCKDHLPVSSFRLGVIRVIEDPFSDTLFFLSFRRPLYKPCKCSGTIGLTHQDCLQSWLQVQRGDGRCELCKTKFRFSPQYAENAPDHLSTREVLLRLSRRAIAQWLPFLVRSAFAASLWLVVAPLVTAYLYQGWMHKPSAILERLNWQLMKMDLVSGAVVAACIIVSFLAMMSFADFLRVEWQHQRGGMRRDRNRLGQPNEPQHPPAEEDVDNGIYDHVQEHARERPAARARNVHFQQDIDDILEADGLSELGEEAQRYFDHDSDDDEDDSDHIEDDYSEDSEDSWEDDDEEEDIADEDDLNMEMQRMMGDLQPALRGAQNDDGRNPPLRRIQANEPRVNRPLVMEQDEPMDMDINIALDEILGVRGPLTAVIRNLLWLLAFNTVYLGFFAFTPRVLGTAIISLFVNSTSVDKDTNSTVVVAQNISQHFSVINVFKASEHESERLNTTFRIPDLATVILGYLTCAGAVVFFRFLWTLSQKVRFLRGDRPRTDNRDAEEVREAFDEMNRLVQGINPDMAQVGDDGVAVGVAIGVALDAMVAITKVGVLLFLKMFVLPILLGLCLDASTMSLFGSTLADRILYAGSDLFSFILLHWVAGITFMLLVTVSVLQLREVAHPGLLAQIIRPQEPQPDLLGNLMNESASTHTKRMIMSFIIYAVLLAMHVYFPVRMLISSGSTKYLPFLELKFFYAIIPQLQVPLELLAFHLCMLALLEKYKNSIGEMQHHWLKFMSNYMGITDSMLPQSIDSFRLVGSRQVFNGERVDAFWFDLAKEGKREELLYSNVNAFVPPEETVINAGETKVNGERVLRFGSDFIRLPIRMPSPGSALRSRAVLLPTKIGRYRLKRDLFNDTDQVIQLWEEVRGTPIRRPPEGWDDLGAGGADVQGRWAWDREKKSTIEQGVAKRKLFFSNEQNGWQRLGESIKLFALLVFSWLSTTVMLGIAVGTPLAIGRCLYFLLRIPERWIHDPLCFAMGSLIFFPMARRFTNAIFVADAPLWRRVATWLSKFSLPPIRKAVVLVVTALVWFGLNPFLLGCIYDIAFLKSTTFFLGEEAWIDNKTAALNWASGSVLLSEWGSLCLSGVLTRRFWRFVFEGPAIQDDENEADARAAAWQNTGGNGLRLTWQGKHGRVARFWDCWKAVVLEWEWDKIDHVILLQDCAMPIALQLSGALSCPIALVILCKRWSPLSILSRMIFIRFMLFVTCCVQVGRVWQDHLGSWLVAAHKTARDDRYLIGEVLMNYEE